MNEFEAFLIKIIDFDIKNLNDKFSDLKNEVEKSKKFSTKDYDKLFKTFNDKKKEFDEAYQKLHREKIKHTIESDYEPIKLLVDNYGNTKKIIYIFSIIGTVLIVSPLFLLIIHPLLTFIPYIFSLNGEAYSILATLSELIGLILIIAYILNLSQLKNYSKTIERVYRIEKAQEMIDGIFPIPDGIGGLYEKQNEARLEMVKRILLDISQEE